uniref:C-type lectin domain-containing protein n=1 Tax=Neogobius melanostomus TaxID=47308 RepID=A0A8C6SG75_9GOBI
MVIADKVIPFAQLSCHSNCLGCPPFGYSFDGRCYKYVATDMTWADAELYCVSQRANLVSIHSLEENNFVKSLIQNFDHSEGHTYIGLSDLHKEGAWMWSDGSLVDFALWHPAQPDNTQAFEHCVPNFKPLKFKHVPHTLVNLCCYK